MKAEGVLRKMESGFGEVVEYTLQLGDITLKLNEFLGQEISIAYQNRIFCIKCGRRIKKSYGEGFCYNCFITAPEADPGIIRPELDMAHLGISRDMEWAKEYSLQDHFVYFAVTGGLKVGVTRSKQVITRWIDQGASRAIKIAKTPYRNLAGLIEVELKKFYRDKTDWRKMLTVKYLPGVDLISEKNKIPELLPGELKSFFYKDNEITEINYPVIKLPDKVHSASFDKVSEVTGRLDGIKGQYLIFGNGIVLNIRSHTGYEVRFSCGQDI